MIRILRILNLKFLCLWSKYKNTSYLLFSFFIIFLLSYITISTYYPEKDYFKFGYDSSFHFQRFISIINAFGDNRFPFFIDTVALDGYGYAENLFYPDIMLVPFAWLSKFSGIVEAFKFMCLFYLVLCALISYLSVWKVSKSLKIGFLFSLLYTFSLFHFNNLGPHGAMGQYISFCFLPLVFWGWYEIMFNNYKNKWYIISIGFSCLILCHLITALNTFIIFLILTLIYYKSIIKKPEKIIFFLLAGLLSILLSAFFLFPFFEQVIGNKFYFQTLPFITSLGDETYPLRRIILGMFAGLTYSEVDLICIGISLILPLFLRIFSNNKHRSNKLADIFVILGFILLFSITTYFPWQIFPFNKLTIIQFPFRFLTQISFLFAFAGSIYALQLITRKSQYIALITLTIFILFIMIKVCGGIFLGHSTGHEFSLTDLGKKSMGANEYIPARVPSVNKEDKLLLEYLYIRGNETINTNLNVNTIKNISREKSKFCFYIEIINETETILPLIYYKGYKATLNNQPVILNQSSDGLVEIKIPSSGNVVVWYDGTVISKISYMISIITLISLLLYSVNLCIKKQTLIKCLKKNE